MARKINKQKNEEMKNKIINTAIEVIIDKSFSNFTLSEVAKRIDVTKATIYWYFSSKEDLIASISDQIWSLEILSVEHLESLNLSATEKLKRVLFQEQDRLSCILPIKLLLEFHSETNIVKEQIQKGYKQYQAILADVLQEGTKNGEFHYNVPTNELARYLLSFFDGLVLHDFVLEKKEIGQSKEVLISILQSILKCEVLL